MESSLSMLPLLLFVSCLASCGAQTGSFPSPPDETVSSSTTPTRSIQATPVLPAANSTDRVIIFFQTAIKSHHEMNETILAQVMKTLEGLIQGNQPHTKFSLTLKNMTKV